MRFEIFIGLFITYLRVYHITPRSIGLYTAFLLCHFAHNFLAIELFLIDTFKKIVG